MSRASRQRKLRAKEGTSDPAMEELYRITDCLTDYAVHKLAMICHPQGTARVEGRLILYLMPALNGDYMDCEEFDKEVFSTGLQQFLRPLMDGDVGYDVTDLAMESCLVSKLPGGFVRRTLTGVRVDNLFKTSLV